MGALRWFCFVILPKLPTFSYISEVSFDRKWIEFMDVPIFIVKNRTEFLVFLLNLLTFEKTESN